MRRITLQDRFGTAAAPVRIRRYFTAPMPSHVFLEERCIFYNVPYRLVGGVNFYQRKEIKDILAYLKTIANGVDDLSVLRIINVPKRGIGAALWEK